MGDDLSQLVCWLVGHKRHPDDARRYERSSHSRCARCKRFIPWSYWNATVIDSGTVVDPDHRKPL